MRAYEDTPTVAQAVYYEIRIGGRLTDGWSDWFGGLTVEGQADGTTILRGSLPDQAALLGMLGRLHGLNLPLISVVRAGSIGPL